MIVAAIFSGCLLWPCYTGEYMLRLISKPSPRLPWPHQCLGYKKDRNNWPAPVTDPSVQWQELGPLPEVEHPLKTPFLAGQRRTGKGALLRTPNSPAAGRSPVSPATPPTQPAPTAGLSALATTVSR